MHTLGHTGDDTSHPGQGSQSADLVAAPRNCLGWEACVDVLLHMATHSPVPSAYAREMTGSVLSDLMEKVSARILGGHTFSSLIRWQQWLWHVGMAAGAAMDGHSPGHHGQPPRS